MDWKPLIKTFASIIFGFALAVISRHWDHPPFPPHFGPMGGGRFVDHFAKDFELNDQQKDQARKIFDEQRLKVDALHKEVFPKFETIREETRVRIREILNESQRQKFDKVHEEMERNRKEHPHEPGEDGPPPPDGFEPGGHHGPPPF